MTLHCRVATTLNDRLAAFRLVYERYRQVDLIKPNPFGVRVLPHHLLPTTAVFVATVNLRAICTVTLLGDGQYGLPMEQIYAREVNDRRGQNLNVGEVSCLAFDPMPVDKFLRVFMQLTRVMAQYARTHGMHQFLIAVHPQHARFYERFMGFEQIGALKYYPSVCDAPAVACCLDFARIDRERPKCYESYFGQALPAEELPRCRMSDDELEYFRPLAERSSEILPMPASFAEWFEPHESRFDSAVALETA